MSRAKALAPTPTEDQEASPPEPPQRDESLSLIPGDPPPLAKGMTSAAEGAWDFSVRDSLTRVFSDQAGSCCLCAVHEQDLRQVLPLITTVQRLAGASHPFVWTSTVCVSAGCHSRSWHHCSIPCLPGSWPLTRLQVRCRWVMLCVPAEPLLDGVAP